MKENQPDIPNEDFHTPKADVTENTPVLPWYEKLQDLFVDKSEETQEDTESGTKKGRFSKLLASIFGKIAPKEEIYPDGPDLSSNHKTEYIRETEAVEISDELPLVVEAASDNRDVYWGEDAEEYIVHEQTDLPERDEEHVENEGLLSVDHEEVLPIAPEEILAQDAEVSPYHQDLDASEVSSRQKRANFYESRAYLDYRIAQEARRLSWEAKRTENQLRQEVDSAKQKLEKVQPKPQENPTKILETHEQPKNPTPERRPETTQKPEVKKTDVEYIETPAKKLIPEKSRNEIPEPTVEVEKPAEKLLEKVVEAADHNEAIEKSYELRHEIKDEEAVIGMATSVGEIVASAVKEQSNIRASNPLASVESLRKVTGKSEQATGALYANAIKGGLYAALVVIIFGVIAYLFVS